MTPISTDKRLAAKNDQVEIAEKVDYDLPSYPSCVWRLETFRQ